MFVKFGWKSASVTEILVKQHRGSFHWTPCRYKRTFCIGANFDNSLVAVIVTYTVFILTEKYC